MSVLATARFKTLLVALIVILAIVIAGVAYYTTTSQPSPTQTYPLPHWPKEIVVRAASVGTPSYIYMSMIAELIEENLGIKTTVQPGGAVANIAAVAEGEVDLAYINEFFIPLYMNPTLRERAGLEPVDLSKVALIAGGVERRYCAVAAADDDVPANTFAELAELVKQGYPLSIVMAGPPKTIEEYEYRALFAKYGVNFDELQIPMPGQAGGWSSFAEGKFNVVIDCQGVPTSAVKEAEARKTDIKPIMFSEEDLDYLIEYFSPDALHKDVIPKGTYDFLKEDYPTVCAFTAIVVRSDMPKDLVYEITKLIAEHKDEIAKAVSAFVYDPNDAWKYGGGLSLHPGAEQYYVEAGYKK